MNEFLRKFDTIRFVAPWSIFRIFFEIFHFLNLNLNFKFGPVWYRPKPEPGRIGLTGSHRFGEPWRQPVGRTGEFGSALKKSLSLMLTLSLFPIDAVGLCRKYLQGNSGRVVDLQVPRKLEHRAAWHSDLGPWTIWCWNQIRSRARIFNMDPRGPVWLLWLLIRSVK